MLLMKDRYLSPALISCYQSTQVGLRQFQHFTAAPAHDRAHHVQAEALGLSQFDFRRDAQLLLGGNDIDQHRAGVIKRLAQRCGQFFGVFHAQAENACAQGDAAKLVSCRSVPCGT